MTSILQSVATTEARILKQLVTFSLEIVNGLPRNYTHTHTPTNEQLLNKATSKEYIFVNPQICDPNSFHWPSSKKGIQQNQKKKKREDEESNNYLKKNSFPYFSVIKRTYKSKQNSMQFLV